MKQTQQVDIDTYLLEISISGISITKTNTSLINQVCSSAFIAMWTYSTRVFKLVSTIAES